MFSNKYIFIYTTVLVVVVAVLLALAATLLQPMQTRNQNVAKMQEILRAAGKTVTAEDAVSVYDSFIASELMVDRQGSLQAEYRNSGDGWKLARGEAEAGRAFDCNVKIEFDKASRHEQEPQAEDGLFPVFVTSDGQYILPLQGKGLWGAIWGYMAVGQDGNTVSGVTFGHKGETPGLGAEIAGNEFQAQFAGKKLFDKAGRFVSITLQKGGAENYPGDISHAVDAVSGGTITSNGVTDMIAHCVRYYVPFIEKSLHAPAAADSLPAAPDTVSMAVPSV